MFSYEFLCHVVHCRNYNNNKTQITLKWHYLQHPPPELMCFFPLVTAFMFIIHALKLMSLEQISIFRFLQVFLHVICHKHTGSLGSMAHRGTFFRQNSLHLVSFCKDILFQISVFMVNYFNLCSHSYALVTVEILHQRGIYCNMMRPAFLASCLEATRHFLNTNRTGIYISVHTDQQANQSPFYGLGRKLKYPFKEH